MQYRHYKAIYLHETAHGSNAKRDTANERYFVNEAILPGFEATHITKQILEMGGVPISVKRVRVSRRKIPADYRVKFLLALHFGVQSGQSAGAVLERLIETEVWPLREQLEPALKILKAGASFSEAMAMIGMYDNTTLSILEAGEHTGTLRQSIEAALAHQERKGSTDALLKGATIMISVDVFVAVSSVAATRFGMLPQTVAQGFKSDDPAAIEQWDRAINIAFIGNDILLLITAACFAFGIWAWMKHAYGTAEDKKKVASWLYKVPFLGPALLHSALSASCGVMGHLLRGGVMFLQAAEITGKSSRLLQVKEYWGDAARQVLAGQTLASALAQDPMTQAEQRVLSSHGNREQLALAFTQISDYREKQASSSNKKFIFAGLASSFIYSGIGIALTLYVNWIQIKGVMSSSGI